MNEKKYQFVTDVVLVNPDATIHSNFSTFIQKQVRLIYMAHQPSQLTKAQPIVKKDIMIPKPKLAMP